MEGAKRRVGHTSPSTRPSPPYISLHCRCYFASQVTAAALVCAVSFSRAPLLSSPPHSTRLSRCSEFFLALHCTAAATSPRFHHHVVVSADVRSSPNLALRLTSSTSRRRLAHPVDQQMALLALDHPYADDGPGELYVQGRQNPNGRLEFKVGETSSMPRRYGEYSKCTKNGHTLQWEFHCRVPYRKLAGASISHFFFFPAYSLCRASYPLILPRIGRRSSALSMPRMSRPPSGVLLA